MTEISRIEPSHLVCEKGHSLNKYFELGHEFVHRLLCPKCDRDIVSTFKLVTKGQE